MRKLFTEVIKSRDEQGHFLISLNTIRLGVWNQWSRPLLDTEHNSGWRLKNSEDQLMVQTWNGPFYYYCFVSVSFLFNFTLKFRSTDTSFFSFLAVQTFWAVWPVFVPTTEVYYNDQHFKCPVLNSLFGSLGEKKNKKIKKTLHAICKKMHLIKRVFVGWVWRQRRLDARPWRSDSRSSSN